jgi:hypothetical protein
MVEADAGATVNSSSRGSASNRRNFDMGESPFSLVEEKM